ncbi:unnamed protein product [Arabis nemorensis]|uniref:Uncharacterized protein n=1 Tax=Arabis nemorensis TaxID=586526 RepID=A0A565BMS4_9BRAS|nr:unnamed protein product [Arabis nemorensis]
MAMSSPIRRETRRSNITIPATGAITRGAKTGNATSRIEIMATMAKLIDKRSRKSFVFLWWRDMYNLTA